MSPETWPERVFRTDAPLSLPPAVANSRGEYLLNGDFVVSMFKREIKVGSAIIEYSGSDHVIERLNCTDRIEEEIVVQVTGQLASRRLICDWPEV